MRTDKDPNFINQVFLSASGKYDLMNDLTSLGMHRRWKSFLTNIILMPQNAVYTDLSCGTGDILINVVKRYRQKLHKIYAIDPNQDMLNFAKDKLYNTGIIFDNIEYIKSSAENLSLINEVDICTVSFGARNFSDIHKGFSNIYNSLKENGVFYCMEFSPNLNNNSLDFLYKKYLNYALPFIGKFCAKNKSAYEYLSNSIQNFLKAEEIMEIMNGCGFKNVDVIQLAFGGVNIFYGKK